ncbi:MULTISPECIES: hypothetical protein [Sorangium]|uniref:Uncharacterized protein n=1 Tax=Sorangium cellulosum TaxID=56 RepID=A0A4P2R5W2_SORCE|nr:MULTISPECIES: hypothetical protein [Sorangium]AUX38534.1 hypothetical protein SOCE836_107780 [Sorangium cellulosum]WCQ97820.1 hypothetical protein NQZ70_10618 [Sorangium sp. Soce836]
MAKPTSHLEETDDNDPTLEALAERLGKPEPGLLEALLDGATEAQLVERGRQIASSRVLTDMRRLYATAHACWDGASKDRREKLRGFSPELLALAVEQAIALERLLDVHESAGQKKDATRATRDAGLRERLSRALLLRDQAYEVLRGVAGSGKEAREELAQAVGTAEDPAALARGLAQLAALGRRYLAQKKGPLAVRARLMRLDQDYVERLEEVAEELIQAAKAAGARPAGQKVTSGDLDRADGINLILLEQIVRVFERANEQDPAIPRLVPIATRRLFSRRPRKKAAGAPSGGTAGGGATSGTPPAEDDPLDDDDAPV